MARHLMLTVVIVFVVYAALLLVINHPFVVQAETAGATTQTMESPVVHKIEQATKIAPERKKNVFKGPTIVGESAEIDLQQAQGQVGEIWQTLLTNKALQNNVDWSKGNIKVYAYYSNFNQDFTSATLTLGFDSGHLRVDHDLVEVTLPTGLFDTFMIDPTTGIASDAAWGKAYEHKNLIERHTLNRQGQGVGADAIVIRL